MCNTLPSVGCDINDCSAAPPVVHIGSSIHSALSEHRFSMAQLSSLRTRFLSLLAHDCFPHLLSLSAPKDFFKQVKHSYSVNVEVNGLELNSMFSPMQRTSMSFLEKGDVKVPKMVTSPAALADRLRGKNRPA